MKSRRLLFHTVASYGKSDYQSSFSIKTWSNTENQQKSWLELGQKIGKKSWKQCSSKTGACHKNPMVTLFLDHTNVIWPTFLNFVLFFWVVHPFFKKGGQFFSMLLEAAHMILRGKNIITSDSVADWNNNAISLSLLFYFFLQNTAVVRGLNYLSGSMNNIVRLLDLSKHLLNQFNSVDSPDSNFM